MNTGFNAEIVQGGVHADTRVDPGLIGYDVSASGVAQVSTTAAATTASGNLTGITSEQSYNQSITVAGDIQNFNYSAQIGSGSSMLCSPWN